MSKKVYILVIMFLTILLIITGTYSVMHYFYNYTSTDWFRKNINRDSYTIVAEQIGNPFWFGDSNICVSIKDNMKKKFILTFNTTIENNGNELNESNFSIEGNEEYVKLTFFNYDGSVSSSYRFYYDDYI